MIFTFFFSNGSQAPHAASGNASIAMVSPKLEEAATDFTEGGAGWDDRMIIKKWDFHGDFDGDFDGFPEKTGMKLRWGWRVCWFSYCNW